MRRRSGILWLTGPRFAGGGVVAGRKLAWSLKKKGLDRAWRPGLYHLDLRRLGAGKIWLPK